MKKINIKELLLWLLVINLGISVGAGLYESRIVLPEYFGTSPDTFVNTGLSFWIYVTTIPLTLLTIANGIVAWKTQGPRRKLFIITIIIVSLERLFTFFYFIPTMAGLMGNAEMTQHDIDTILSQWTFLNNFRHLLSIVGWLTALKTLTIQNDK